MIPPSLESQVECLLLSGNDIPPWSHLKGDALDGDRDANTAPDPCLGWCAALPIDWGHPVPQSHTCHAACAEVFSGNPHGMASPFGFCCRCWICRAVTFPPTPFALLYISRGMSMGWMASFDSGRGQPFLLLFIYNQRALHGLLDLLVLVAPVHRPHGGGARLHVSAEEQRSVA